MEIIVGLQISLEIRTTDKSPGLTIRVIPSSRISTDEKVKVMCRARTLLQLGTEFTLYVLAFRQQEMMLVIQVSDCFIRQSSNLNLPARFAAAFMSKLKNRSKRKRNVVGAYKNIICLDI